MKVNTKTGLSDITIREFQEIWRREYDEDIAFDQASEKALRFLNLFRAIYQPIKKQAGDKNGKS